MRRDTAISKLRAHEADFRAKGVVGMVLFGSVARDEAQPDSDVDVLVDLDDENYRISLVELGGIAVACEDILGTTVDIVDGPPRKLRLKEAIERDGVRVF